MYRETLLHHSQTVLHESVWLLKCSFDTSSLFRFSDFIADSWLIMQHIQSIIKLVALDL